MKLVIAIRVDEHVALFYGDKNTEPIKLAEAIISNSDTDLIEVLGAHWASDVIIREPL
jgi:hypothetical protein